MPTTPANSMTGYPIGMSEARPATDSHNRRQPWRVRLQGSRQDLEEMARRYQSGAIKVYPHGNDFFLEAESLNQFDHIDLVFSPAEHLTQRLTALALICRADAGPVSSAGHIVGSNGDGAPTGPVRLQAKIDVQVVSGALIAGPDLQMWAKLAERDAAVRDVLTEWKPNADFAALRRITETLTVDLGDGNRKVGLAKLVENGWSTEHQNQRFRHSANHGDGTSTGAHARAVSPSNPPPDHEQMSLGEAWEFIRCVLAKWLQAKEQDGQLRPLRE